MKTTLHFTLLLLCISFTAFGQLNVKQGDVLESYGTTSETTTTLEITLEAGSTDVGQFLWEAQMSESMPEEWQFIICDTELCYAPGILMCAESKPNIIAPGSEGSFKFDLVHNQAIGEGILQVRFFSAADHSETLLVADLYFDVSTASSIKDDVDSVTLNLYPNPTSDYFQIEQDDNVERVAVYSIVGREMFSYEHKVGQAYSVSELSNGYYMARLIGGNGETLKIIRFNKK